MYASFVEMATMSLTEFNQNPSRATKLADEGEVVILRRGVPAYRLERANAGSDDPVEALVMSGVLARPRARTRRNVHRTASTEVDVGRALDSDRQRLDD